MNRRRRSTGAAVALLCSAATLAACGGSSPRTTTSDTAIPPSTVRTATCNVWRVSTVSQRRALLDQLRAFYTQRIGTGGGNPDGPGPSLTTERGYAVLQAYCAPPFARAFKLYKLYGRAAGFASPASG